MAGLIGGRVGYAVLKRLAPRDRSRERDGSADDAYAGRSKLRALLGDSLLGEIAGETVVDFGCGYGSEAIELARAGAARVIGVDIQERFLEVARRNAADASVADRVEFGTQPPTSAGVIISLDAFEHFGDAAGVLRTMHDMLRPGGRVYIAFGPTWYHPLGGHLFSVFPWAHLAFTERALLRWRADFKSDGATRFAEVEGGLNQMTIRRFLTLVDESPLQAVHVELVPIRQLAWLASRLTREFTTAIVRATLVRA